MKHKWLATRFGGVRLGEGERTIAGRVCGEGGELGVEFLRVERVLLLEVRGGGCGERREGEDDERGEPRRDHIERLSRGEDRRKREVWMYSRGTIQRMGCVKSRRTT